MTTIAVLGAGKIGEALLSGFLNAGRSPKDLMFTERYPERAAQLERTYQVRAHCWPSSPSRSARAP
jgi:pyrroline-5-carboxylate reductase